MCNHKVHPAAGVPCLQDTHQSPMALHTTPRAENHCEGILVGACCSGSAQNLLTKPLPLHLLHSTNPDPPHTLQLRGFLLRPTMSRFCGVVSMLLSMTSMVPPPEQAKQRMPPFPAHKSHGSGSFFRPLYSAAPTAAVTAPPTMTSCTHVAPHQSEPKGQRFHGKELLSAQRQAYQCHQVERPCCSLPLPHAPSCARHAV